jgi:thermitase
MTTMQRAVLLLLLGVLLSAAGLVAADDQQPAPLPPECVPDELLVKFRPGADPAVVSARHGATISSVIAGIEVYVLSIPPGTVSVKVAEFQADPEVEFAEPNGIMRLPEAPPSAAEPCGDA